MSRAERGRQAPNVSPEPPSSSRLITGVAKWAKVRNVSTTARQASGATRDGSDGFRRIADSLAVENLLPRSQVQQLG
jgi:hypothetical protein